LVTLSFVRLPLIDFVQVRPGKVFGVFGWGKILD